MQTTPKQAATLAYLSTLQLARFIDEATATDPEARTIFVGGSFLVTIAAALATVAIVNIL